jgi:hypothetical protein
MFALPPNAKAHPTRTAHRIGSSSDAVSDKACNRSGCLFAALKAATVVCIHVTFLNVSNIEHHWDSGYEIEPRLRFKMMPASPSQLQGIHLFSEEFKQLLIRPKRNRTWVPHPNRVLCG